MQYAKKYLQELLSWKEFVNSKQNRILSLFSFYGLKPRKGNLLIVGRGAKVTKDLCGSRELCCCCQMLTG